MRESEDYYGYGNYDDGMLHLLDTPSWRPISDSLIWVKHTLLLLGGRLPQWILAILLMIFSTASIMWGLMIVLSVPYIKNAMNQHEWWAGVLSVAIFLFIQVLPLLFAAGLVSIAAGVSEERSFVFGRLFSGFGEQKWTLVRLHLFWLLVAFACLMAIGKLGSQPAGTGDEIIWLCVGLILLFFLCNWMSLPLIMLQGMPAAKAIQMSLKGSLKNIVQLSGFLLIILVLAFFLLALFTVEMGEMVRIENNLGIVVGLLVFYAVVFPILPVISYVSYRNIWTNRPLT